MSSDLSKRIMKLERIWEHKRTGRPMNCKTCGKKLTDWNCHHHDYCDLCDPLHR